MDSDRFGGRASDDVVEAIGKASEALEYVERARGHLYGFHQLMGHADLVFGEAVDLLRATGLHAEADAMESEIVGRNVLEGRWTFQVVDEFDELYFGPATDAVRAMEARHLEGRRHVHEARMKEDRRSHGVRAHERDPASAPAPVTEPR